MNFSVIADTFFAIYFFLTHVVKNALRGDEIRIWLLNLVLSYS